MISINTFSLINDRLRAIFLANTDTPFSGISVLLYSNFFQLPLVSSPPLYIVLKPTSSPTIIKGSRLY
jgi:hypothetical protein